VVLCVESPPLFDHQEFTGADKVLLIIKTQSFHSGDDFHNKAPLWVQIPSGNLTWPFIVDLPIENGDFPASYVKLPEGINNPMCSIKTDVP